MPKVPRLDFTTKRKAPPKTTNLTHIEATARAWGVEADEMQRIWDWLEHKVPEYRRWSALHTILRKKYTPPNKYKKIKVKQTRLL